MSIPGALGRMPSQQFNNKPLPVQPGVNPQQPGSLTPSMLQNGPHGSPAANFASYIGSQQQQPQPPMQPQQPMQGMAPPMQQQNPYQQMQFNHQNPQVNPQAPRPLPQNPGINPVGQPQFIQQRPNGFR